MNTRTFSVVERIEVTKVIVNANTIDVKVNYVDTEINDSLFIPKDFSKQMLGNILCSNLMCHSLCYDTVDTLWLFIDEINNEIIKAINSGSIS